jgi:hypothetical protein
MAKATIKLNSGTNITVEGTPEEVTSIINLLKHESSHYDQQKHKKNHTNRQKGSMTSPTDLLISLTDGDFFKQPKDLAAIKLGLEEIGYKYPVTTISTLVRRLVRKRILRRFKEDKRWMYTNS